MIRWLLTPDISRRATITDVCKDSWINHGYNTPLLEVAENMALIDKFPREQLLAAKLNTENNMKNERDKTIVRKAASQLDEKEGKFTSIFTKKFENNLKTNDAPSQPRKSNMHEQMTNYDVRFVLNKLIAAVEASLNADKSSRNSTKCNAPAAHNVENDKTKAETINSAYVIPIFEVTSTIPSIPKEISGKNSKINNAIPKISPKLSESNMSKENCMKRMNSNICFKKLFENSRTNIQTCDVNNKPLSYDSNPLNKKLFGDSQNCISGQSDTRKSDFKARKQQHGHLVSDPLILKNKRKNDCLPFEQKQPGPFVKTKHHVLNLARILSLNYEKFLRNSFRMQTGKKKLPGKITIPPTFDPNNPPREARKLREEKKELLIFPTVSVSENKEKILKKIDKIKKAALDKNFIIRSDSKTRVRIENYIRSQVKRIQDLVREEQRSLHGSLEHLDEQSLRDMSEMYYCAFGSENTDSGIANNDDDEYFCFLCSKPNLDSGTSKLVDSLVLETIKKGCLYTSNHLHIPRGKDQYVSNHINQEYGSLSRCKSEIKFPIEYLNYISPNKLDLNKITQNKQHIQRNDIGNTKYFLTIPARVKPDSSNLRILRSASDSFGQLLSNNAFEVLKLNTESHDDTIQNYKLFPHYLSRTSNGLNYSEMTDYDTQSCASNATFIKTSQMREKDDGIGDSNDSFQSYIETLESAGNESVISRSMSCQYMNFSKGKSNNNQRTSAKLSSKLDLKSKGEDERREEIKNKEQGAIIGNILDSTSWIADLDSENDCNLQDENKKLTRRNTMSCLRDEKEMREDVNYDPSKTEFESFLWNAYKEHLLENTLNDTEYTSSPTLNYYSLNRNTKFKGRDSKSMDYIYRENGNDFSDFSQSIDKDLTAVDSTTYKDVLKNSLIRKKLPDRSNRQLNRTKSVSGDTLKDNDMEDIILRLREDRKLSLASITSNSPHSTPSPCSSAFLNELDKRDQRRKAGNNLNRRQYPKSGLPSSKREKTEYKKSFLQLLALKRVQEAEKELDRSHRSDQVNIEDENSGSLLEALKTHGYKSVISQRFQGTDDDLFDPFQMKYLKSPRNLRAELARLNYIYYQTLPRYTLDPYEESDYLYDDMDYTRTAFNGLTTHPFYGMQVDFRKQASKQHVNDWLDTSQIDEYLMSKRMDSMHIPEETTPTLETRKCCTQWGREGSRSFGDENLSESQDTVEESPSNNTFNVYSRNKDLAYLNETGNANYERPQTSSAAVDDEKQESVHDRIWRKSFYSRFNNRALSRKERPSLVESELASENRLGQLNDIYNSLKTGYDKHEMSPWDSRNSFHTKRSKKHSQSFDKFGSSASIKKKYSKSTKEKDTILANEDHRANKNFTEDCKTAFENEEPEH